MLPFHDPFNSGIFIFERVQAMKRLNRKRLFDIIQIGQRDDIPSRVFDIFIVIVIIANIAVMFLETFDELSRYNNIFHIIETITIFIFCVEYALRIWTADYLYPDRSRGRAVIKFLTSFDGVVDLLTILPFFFLTGFVAFRMLRVVRIFHLFRINAAYDSFNVITKVLYDKRNQLLSSVFIIFVLMLASSLCMYSVEHAAQPEVFKNAFSGIWWCLATIFTVGYGDIYPITALGRAMTVVITLLGVGAVAIPTGIISAGFVESYMAVQQNDASHDPAARNTVSLTVDEKSPYAGCAVSEIEKNNHITIAAIVRDGAILLPTDQVKVKPGDIMIYQF